MSLGELVFWYCAIIFILLLALAVLLLQRKAHDRPIFTQSDWRVWFGFPRERVLTGDFWLKLFLATFIALSLGIIIAIFILPYGTIVALAALAVTLTALIVLVPKLLA